MPKNVMKLLKRTANHARNAFDMSHRHLCVANFGELLPITSLEVVPDDYVELSVADLLRAAPMVTSPFLRAKQHLDVYFVPYCDLWSQFEAFMTKKSEPKHANAYGSAAVPHVNLFTLQNTINSYIQQSDVVGHEYRDGALRLLDLFGYGRVDTSGDTTTHPDVNLWRLAAYNKIWYEHYRQQYYDNGLRILQDSDFSNGTANPAVIFNFDDMICSSATAADLNHVSGNTVIQSGSFTTRLLEMSQMRYRLWKKDLFTGLMPSTQFGNVSSVPLDLNLKDINKFGLKYDGATSPNSRFLGLSANSSNVGVATYQGQVFSSDNKFSPLDANGNVVGFVVGSDANAASLDILSLRKSEALQIWREAALTAGNRIADNMRAHYGDEAEYAMHESQLIGSVTAPLNISDVNSTAQTTQTPTTTVNTSLGDVAGKGISTLDDRVIKFKAKKFGVIMVIFSLLPEAEYQSDGIDRMNQLLEQEDYFVPEYMDLGLEAVSSLDFYNTPLAASAVIGYAPRYIGYKQKLDKCYQGFKQNQAYAPWASPKRDVAQALSVNSGVMPLQCLYVNPHLFDVNFVVGANVQGNYQFICDFFFDCTKVSPMSVSSLPRI